MHSFFESLSRHSGGGRRSTAMQPVQWIIAILIGGLIGAITAKAPSWILVLIAILLCLALCLYLFAYIFFMIKRPEALRSEAFTITKLAIQKGFVGDSMLGEFAEDRYLLAPNSVLPLKIDELAKADEKQEEAP